MALNETFGKGLALYKQKKYKDAVEYFKQALNDSVEAQNYLANCYLAGLGIEKNESEAIKLYRKSASLRYAPALLNLGYCYETGTGVKQNYEYASDYYERASVLKNSIAMVKLANLYYNGLGVDKDLKEAEDLLNKAANLGNEEAKEMLAKLFSKPTLAPTKKPAKQPAKPQSSNPDYVELKERLTRASDNFNKTTANNEIKNVYFGQYPNTLVSDKKIIAKLDKMTPNEHGYYNLDGVLYASAKDIFQYFRWNREYKFSDGTVQDYKPKYFKVEPIKWRVLKEVDGILDLMTEDIIDISVNNTSEQLYNNRFNHYADWGTRKWLNNEFIDLAFSGVSSNLILTELNSNYPKKYNDYKLKDYVYLLSEIEAQDPSYGFAANMQKDPNRKARLTDYALGRGCIIDSNNEYGLWMLREINYKMTSLGIVQTEGQLHCVSTTGGIYNYNYHNVEYGLRPVIRIKKSALENPNIDEEIKPEVSLKPKKETKVLPQAEPVVEKEVVVKPKEVKVDTSKGIYVGKYPQSLVTDQSLIDNLLSASVNINGYYEFNGCEYEKVIAKPYREKYKFSDGSPIITGKEYFFKVEPIKWRVLSNENNEMLLMCNSLLDSTKFYQAMDERSVDGVIINPRNYEYSEIRKWLNDYFYNKAFSSNDNLIKSTIDNSVETCLSDYTGEVSNNLNDYVFLLSYKDVINSNYSFDESDNLSSTRELKLTDYNKAKGAHMMTNQEYGNNGSWWLRTPSDAGLEYVCYVDYDGIINYCTTTNKLRSVCVAIKIKK